MKVFRKVVMAGFLFVGCFQGVRSRSHLLPPGEGGGSQVKGWEVALQLFWVNHRAAVGQPKPGGPRP